MNVETRDCPDYETDSWEPTEPDGNCDLCVYKASIEWALLEKEDREYITLFMKFLIEHRDSSKEN